MLSLTNISMGGRTGITPLAQDRPELELVAHLLQLGHDRGWRAARWAVGVEGDNASLLQWWGQLCQ